ncbi:NAD-dependent succinate-semialdehyde dehydrogenase [Haliscomenobacter sp.]|uniref:NAD-dependent succinate-semialdehyde dehydrogenase n=1 Tax=Haliscomenobacter sp. TaxID=2717303 RepID=UPI003BAB29AD
MQKNYINGAWLDALNGGTWPVINPATEQTIATVPFGGVADVQVAIDAAVAAFQAWKNTNAWQRADILKKVADLMRARSKELAQLTIAEAGKPMPEANGEWVVAAQFFEWYAEEAKRNYGRVIPASRNNKRMSVISQPIGVVGIVTAWNFPVWNLCRVWAAAIAAGCTIVAKPSEYTPLTAMALMELLEEAGLPAGVANLVLGDAAAIGETLLARPEVRKIHFVGSTRVGKILLEGAAKTNTKLSLELGGNAPCLIFPDVNVEAVAKSTAIAKTRNCGQVCVSPQRFLVHEGIYANFVERVSHYMAQLKVGNGLDDGTQIGPLINARQREQVEQIVGNSIAQGAHLNVGGQRPAHLPKGYFYTPTVLSEMAPEQDIFRKEVFGPVMGIMPFTNTDEAIALANDTEYGLASYLWTNDLRTSIKVSEALEFGIVGINEWAAHATEAPFGGWKQSGLGYECGEEGLQEYLEKKLISVGDL